MIAAFFLAFAISLPASLAAIRFRKGQPLERADFRAAMLAAALLSTAAVLLLKVVGRRNLPGASVLLAAE